MKRERDAMSASKIERERERGAHTHTVTHHKVAGKINIASRQSTGSHAAAALVAYT